MNQIIGRGQGIARRMSRFAVALLAFLAVSAAASAQQPQMNWYIGAPVLNLIYQDNPSLAERNFNRPSTFVAVSQAGQLALIPNGWNVIRVFTFFDETGR